MKDAHRSYAQNTQLIAELIKPSQLQQMLAAVSPITIQLAGVSDQVTKQIEEFKRFQVQAAPWISEVQRATLAASQSTELKRWVEQAASHLNQFQFANSLSLEQLRRTIQFISPQITEFSKAIDVASLPVLKVGAAIPTAGTAPHAVSLSIGAASAALGLRKHEFLGALIAEAQARTTSKVEQQSFAAEAFIALEAAEAADQPSAIPEFLDQFIAKIRSVLQTIENLPGLMGLVGIVSLVVACVSLRYLAESATTTDVEHLRSTTEDSSTQQQVRLDRINEAVRSKLDELINVTRDAATARIPTLPQRPVYRVRRSVPIRPTKGMKGTPVGVLQVGDIVSVMTYSKKWVEIEYFDHLLGREVLGWVAKKYLRRVP